MYLFVWDPFIDIARLIYIHIYIKVYVNEPTCHHYQCNDIVNVSITTDIYIYAKGQILFLLVPIYINHECVHA